MNKPEPSDLPNIHMSVLSESLTRFRNSIIKAFEPMFTQDALNIVSQSMNEFASSIKLSITQNVAPDIINSSLKQLSQCLSSYDFSSMLTNASIEDNCITLNDDAVEIFTDFFEENNATTAPQITNKMSVRTFLIDILLPILLTLLQMAQNAHYQKVNSLDSQTQYLQEAEFQDQLLDIEKQNSEQEILQTEYLEQLIHFLTNELSEIPEDIQESAEDVPVAHDQHRCTLQESAPTPDTSAKSSADGDKVPDEPDYQDADE